MRWLADECVDAASSAAFAAPGTTYSMRWRSRPARQTQKCYGVHKTMLLTEDKDFGELVFRSEMAVPGVVLLRPEPEKCLLKWTRLQSAVEQFGERLFGRYLVIEEARFRSRPLLKSIRG